MDMARQLEINEARHYRADDRFLDKMEKAQTLIGELCREGKTVYYVNIRGNKGKIREGAQHELIDFLIRNRYV